MVEQQLGVSEQYPALQMDIKKTLDVIGAKRTPLIDDLITRGISPCKDPRENHSLSSPQDNQEGMQFGMMPNGDTSFRRFETDEMRFITNYPDRDNQEIALHVSTYGETSIKAFQHKPQLLKVNRIATLEMDFDYQSLWERVVDEQPLIDSEVVWQKIFQHAKKHDPIALNLTLGVTRDNETIYRVELFVHLMKNGEFIEPDGALESKEVESVSWVWKGGEIVSTNTIHYDTYWHQQGRHAADKIPSNGPYIVKPRE